jgi:hypothetical protein
MHGYTWGRAEDEADLGLAQGGEGGAVTVCRPQQGGERGRSYHTKINNKKNLGHKQQHTLFGTQTLCLIQIRLIF